MKEEKRFINDEGDEVFIDSKGNVFINGSIVYENLSDADSDRYAVEVQNGEGYYDEDGKFRRFNKD
ncbi:MAG: hypothetical protein ILA13_00450 [Eubacterium sp.]|nr:hypothetical protein [Eubacterium sp.]